MAEVQDAGELLKVLYATIGRRPTKFIAWVFVGVALIFAVKWGIEAIDWFIDRFALETLNLTVIFNALASTLLAMIVLVGFATIIALIIAFILRFGIDALQRRKVERLSLSLLNLLREIEVNTSTNNLDQIQSYITQAEIIRTPPLVFRILDRVFPVKRKK